MILRSSSYRNKQV